MYILKKIPPEALNSLIVATFASNKTATVWPSLGVIEHEPRHVNILYSLISTDSRWKSILVYSLDEQV